MTILIENLINFLELDKGEFSTAYVGDRRLTAVTTLECDKLSQFHLVDFQLEKQGLYLDFMETSNPMAIPADSLTLKAIMPEIYSEEGLRTHHLPVFFQLTETTGNILDTRLPFYGDKSHEDNEWTLEFELGHLEK